VLSDHSGGRGRGKTPWKSNKRAISWVKDGRSGVKDGVAKRLEYKRLITKM